MLDQLRLQIIEEHPIGKGLDAFRASFDGACGHASISCTPDALERLGQQDLQNLALSLLFNLQIHPASRLLRSSGSSKNLFNDLSELNRLVSGDNFDLNRIKPLFKTAITNDNDALIWKEVYNAVTQSTPPQRPATSSLQPTTSSLQQTPLHRNTGSLANTSELLEDMDTALKHELGTMYVGVPQFYEKFFGRVADLETVSKAVFEKCKEGSEPLFSNGWSGWPKVSNQDPVLSWFVGLSEKLATFAEGCRSIPTHRRRRPLAQPNKGIRGSIGLRKLDVGFVDNLKDSEYTWSDIMIPGEVKSSTHADKATKAWLHLGKYAREILAAQDTRRFVLGFTICGSFMRVWNFDRLGAIASDRFDINKDGLEFVKTVLGFLWISEEDLGFDPTIRTGEEGERFIEIVRNGSKERIIIDKTIQRVRCVVGRATTCWKAHPEGRPQVPLVIKDSWQYPEREEEGELLYEVTEKDLPNVARHYHHETVQIHRVNDDVQNNVRGGLDITSAKDYGPKPSPFSSAMVTSSISRRGYSSGIVAGKKRSSSQTDASLPHSKRPYSPSLAKAGGNLPNRVHRRVIICDYGHPIYKASSPTSLLLALGGCIKGHESLRKAGILHRDISINNLLINEDTNNPSRPSFLIDLDLAIKEDREGAWGAKGKTGTRAFMAIGALLGEQHSFMHDLESFFWVLFWICIHCDGPGEGRIVAQFNKWNYDDTDQLAAIKMGYVSTYGYFQRMVEPHVTEYYRPLIPLLGKLRKVVFPGGKPWEQEDETLYSQMKDMLLQGVEDLK